MTRKCRKWTEAETERTIKYLAEGKSLNEIGRLLNRSHHTVRANMEKVPGYVSRGRGRPKGSGCRPVVIGRRPIDQDVGMRDWLSMPLRAAQCAS